MAEFFDYDPDYGLTRYTEMADEDRIRLITVADVEPVLDHAKALRNAPEISERGIKKGFWHYATIPPIVQLLLRKKGIDVFNPEHGKRVRQEIDRNYPYCKTTDKRHV